MYILYAMFNTQDPDVNYTIGPSVAIIECNLAIITACAPTLWPLARQWKSLGETANSYSLPSKYTHCHCGKYHGGSGYRSRSSIQCSGSRTHTKPQMSYVESLGTIAASPVFPPKKAPWDLTRPETSNSSTIMTVSQGLRETRNADLTLEPEVKRSLSSGRGRCTWPDAAGSGEYEAGVLIQMELSRISDWDGDEDIVLVNMGEGEGERALEPARGRVEPSSQV